MRRLKFTCRPIRHGLVVCAAWLCSLTVVAAEDPREAEVRKALAALGRAFNAHDAAAVAQAWVDQGVLYDAGAGLHIEGRPAIQQHYARLFQASPKPTLQAEISAVEFTAQGAALVRGSAAVAAGEGAAEVTDFVAELSREGDRWLLTSVEETDHDPLSDLEWLVGDWLDEEGAGRAKSTFAWNESGDYLVRTWSTPAEDETSRSGTQYIAWDAGRGQLRTWAFSSTGAVAEGHWSPQADHWAIHWLGRLADGRAATAIQILKPIDADSFQVQWTNIEVDGLLRPSTEPVTVRRVGEPAAGGNAP